MDCSVVIVNYHTEPALSDCLASLERSAGCAVEVLVVDNSSTLAGSGLPQRFPGVRFLDNGANLGFARATNRGLRLARGRHLLLLNPDTVVHPGAVGRLVAHLDARPDVGAVGPRLLDPDGRLQYSCRRFPGYLTIFFGRYSLATRLLPRNPISRRYLYLDWDHASAADVDWLSGACLMVRREVLAAPGLLDERFFLFVEDMDWCRRIRNAGWRVMYLPEAVVTHVVGVSHGGVSDRVVWARHRGMLRYVTKHFHAPRPVEALVALALVTRAGALMLGNRVRGAA